MNEKILGVQSTQTGRRYDLDWLRSIAILTVFVYHSTRFFDLDDWHVKNATTYVWVSWLGDLVTQWMMPLIFVISGASCYYAIHHKRGSVDAFLKDKVLRLLVPLLVGIFTLSTIQVYLERITHSQFRGSFLAFLPHYFEGIYLSGGTGNFAFSGMHLWYLQWLFVFILVLLPFFWWTRGGPGGRFLRRLGDCLALPGALLLPVLVTILLINIEDSSLLLQVLQSGGWSMLPYFWFFLAGFVIASHIRLQQRIVQARWVGLSLTLGLVALSLIQRDWADMHRDVASWCGLYAILGFAMKHLTRTNRLLSYANEAVLPFYILHQNVLLWIGYFVVRWAIPDSAKYLVILVTSFVTIMVLYEYVVRRTRWLRFLFGMKPLRSSFELVTARAACYNPGPGGGF